MAAAMVVLGSLGTACSDVVVDSIVWLNRWVDKCGGAGVPITFDFHHHRFCTGGLTEEQAFKAAIATWPKGVRPQVTSLVSCLCSMIIVPSILNNCHNYAWTVHVNLVHIMLCMLMVKIICWWWE